MDLVNRKPTRLAIDLLAASGGERVIDIGCGTGRAMKQLLRHGRARVTGVDRSHTMILAAHARLKSHDHRTRSSLFKAELGKLPFADHSFDAALALNMLYFCDHDGRMIADLRRVLCPGGRLVAYVTHGETMKRWAFANQGTHRLFDEEALAALLMRGGFAPHSINVQTVPITRSVVGLLAFATA